MSNRMIFGVLGVIAMIMCASTAMANAPIGALTDCSSGNNKDLISLGPGNSYDLSDVTISNGTSSAATVKIWDTFTQGARYVVPANSTLTQKFETPIRFAGPNNSPFLTCGTTNANIGVSIMGTIR